MKYIYTVILLLSLSRCNYKAKTDDQPVLSKKTFTYAEQQRVISDINFDISKKQFDNLYKKYLESKKCKSGCTIDKFEYYTEYAKFKNDKLYSIEFANIGGYEKSIPEILNDAYQFVKSEYGEPDISKKLSSWPGNQIFTVYKWKIGKKNIEINVDRVKMELGVRLLIYKN